MNNLLVEPDRQAETDELSLILAEHGVVQERRGEEHPCLSKDDYKPKSSSVRGRCPARAKPADEPSSDPDELLTDAYLVKKPTRMQTVRNLAARGFLAASLLVATFFAWSAFNDTTNESTVAQTTPVSFESQPGYETKNIEDLVPGDTVVAMNPETGEVAEKKVLQKFYRIADHLQILTLRSTSGEVQTIETTDEHPFWVRSQQKWFKAEHLKTGDRVTGPNGEAQTVVNNIREEHPDGIEVYNFEVEDFHTYFVLANGSRAPPVLVHNAHGYKSGPPVKQDKNGRWRDSKGQYTYAPQGTKEIKTRPTKGADGGTSQHIIERDAAGNVISKTHRVVKDGKVLHQHQDHVGKYGGERRFPDQWKEYPTINAPDHVPRSFGRFSHGE